MVIDLSANNGVVDYAQLQGVDEIFIRASLGYGDKDKNLARNAKDADAYGFPVSYYHFAYPHSGVDPAEDAIKQANYFHETIKDLPQFTHLAVDLENFNAHGGDTTISQQNYAIWLQNFLDTIESHTGDKCIIYTYADYLNRHLPDGHTFGKYPLWIANYNKSKLPALPKGWDSYLFWQYSESGIMAGIDGHVDLSKTA